MPRKRTVSTLMDESSARQALQPIATASTDQLDTDESGGAPTKLLGGSVRSVSEFVDVAMQIDQDDGPLWFRGLTQEHHRLVPSLYRNAGGKTEPELRQIEEQLNRRFRDRSMPHARDETADSTALQSWWRLFTMQHYGTPTRLLDWSENALTALCFAVLGSAKEPKSNALVWVLKPWKWNNLGNSNHSHALSVDEHGAGPYSPLPSTNQHVPTNWPLAIYGMHNSPRIVQQQGTFVVFAPAKIKSMEDHALQHGVGGQEALRAICIEKDSIPLIAKQLQRLGFAHSSLYPDLHGLATDLKSEFGY